MNTTREQKYRELTKDTDFNFKEIRDINFRPHPFTIGPKHLVYAHEHHNGLLGEETARRVQCAHPGCQLSYEQHQSDTILFLSLKRTITNSEARDQMQVLIEAGMERDGVDGFVLVETEEKFRVLPDEGVG